MNIYIVIITIFAVIFNLIILIFPKNIMTSASNGLVLWYKYALPSLFPFMLGINFLKQTPFPLFLSKILSPVTKKIFKIRGYGTFAIVSGLLSGYPIGAKIVCDLYNENKISKGEARYLISFCNNSGPLFVIGTVGIGFLNDKSMGYFLLAVHYMSALIIALITPKPNTLHQNTGAYKYISMWDNMRDSLMTSISSITAVGGYIVLFSIVCTMLSNITDIMGIQLSPTLSSIVYGLLEITNGCSSVKEITPLSISIISGMIGFGGLSIQSQSMSYISLTDIPAGGYFASKLAQGCISFGLAYILLGIFHILPA